MSMMSLFLLFAMVSPVDTMQMKISPEVGSYHLHGPKMMKVEIANNNDEYDLRCHFDRINFYDTHVDSVEPIDPLGISNMKMILYHGREYIGLNQEGTWCCIDNTMMIKSKNKSYTYFNLDKFFTIEKTGKYRLNYYIQMSCSYRPYQGGRSQFFHYITSGDIPFTIVDDNSLIDRYDEELNNCKKGKLTFRCLQFYYSDAYNLKDLFKINYKIGDYRVKREMECIESNILPYLKDKP